LNLATDRLQTYWLGAIWTIVTFLWSCAPVLAQLDGISEIGHSYQSDARGGCEVSIGDTALAHVRQPASCVLQDKPRFDSKLTNIFPINRWSNSEGVSRSAVDQLFSYNLGVTHPLGKRCGMGLAWETGGWQTKFPNVPLSQKFLTSEVSSLGFKKFSVVGNLAAKVTDKFFVGAGPHIAVVRLSTKMPAGAGLLDVPTSYAAGAGYQVGALYHPSKFLSFGASYASPVYMGGIHRTADFLTLGRRTPVPVSIRPFTIPGRVSFGVSGAPSEKMKVALEGAYLNYGSSILGRTKLNSPLNTAFPPGFRNLWVINTGMDYEIARGWSGSIGYVWNSQPIYGPNMVPFYAANVQNQLTWGLRYRRGRVWTGFAHIIGLPAATHANGTTHLALGAIYPNSTVRQMLQSFNFGVGFNF